MPADSGIADLLSYEDVDGQQSDHYPWPEFDENTASTLCYTQRHHRQPQGCAVQPPLDDAARLAAALPDALGMSGARRDPAGGADVPRQRLGHAVQRADDRRQAGVPGPRLDGKSVYELIETERVTCRPACPRSGWAC